MSKFSLLCGENVERLPWVEPPVPSLGGYKFKLDYGDARIGASHMINSVNRDKGPGPRFPGLVECLNRLCNSGIPFLQSALHRPMLVSIPTGALFEIERVNLNDKPLNSSRRSLHFNVMPRNGSSPVIANELIRVLSNIENVYYRVKNGGMLNPIRIGAVGTIDEHLALICCIHIPLES